MQVDEQLRPPLQERAHARLRLRLRHREPVAVHVEQRVVDAATGPRLRMFGAERRRVGKAAARSARAVHEAVAAVGVLQRIDADEALGQHLLRDRIVLRGEQVVQHEQRRVGARRLVAVHAVGEPRHRRLLAQQAVRLVVGQAARIGEPLHVQLQIRQPLHAFGCRQQRVPQLAAFPAGAVVEQPQPVGCRSGERVQVLLDVGVRRDLGAELVAGDLLQRRDLAVVGDAGRERGHRHGSGIGDLRQQRGAEERDQGERAHRARDCRSTAARTRVRAAAHHEPTSSTAASLIAKPKPFSSGSRLSACE